MTSLTTKSSNAEVKFSDFDELEANNAVLASSRRPDDKKNAKTL